MASIGVHPQAASSHVVLDLEQVIREKIEKLPTIPPKPCIFKIPQNLRDLNPEAYTPHRVAIGPYHADAEQFKSMEPHKLRYLNSLMSSSRYQSKLKEYITEIEKLESEARRCYSEIEHLRNEFGSQNFKSMLLLDGAFTVKFLCRMFLWMIDCTDSEFDMKHLAVIFEFDIMDANDPIFNFERTRYEVLWDLILLENQLPFFILEALFDCTFSSRSPPITFAELAYVSLRGLVPVATNKILREELERSKRETPMHLLDLMRMCCLDVPRTNPHSKLPTRPQSFLMKHCSCKLITSCICMTEHGKTRSLCSHLAPQGCLGRKKEQHQPESQYHISVTELHNAGIRFKRADRGQTFDVKFDKAQGVIEMPHLFFDDMSEVFFRNVIAFEQHHLNEFEVINYVAFLERLINTVEDVHILEESELMVNYLGSKEDVATICNNFTTHLYIKYSPEYFQMFDDLAAHVMKPWNKWKAMLRRNYFGSPWATMSVIAAVVLLVLTALQTVATVYSTHWH